MRFSPALLCSAALLAFASAAHAQEVRFYPGARAYAYELDAAHGASGLVLHNIAILNTGPSPFTLDEVAIELLDGERAIDRRTLGAEELQHAATGGAGLQQAGLLNALAFQFGGANLLPEDATLSPDLVLGPGEAVLITSQVFAYRGARDSVRVRVNGAAAEGRIAISNGLSAIAYSFPLEGQWYNGAGASFHSHHRWTPMQEFAFDFVRIGANGATHRGAGARFSDYYAYGAPVLAAAEGRVAFVIADEAEDARAMRQAGESIEAYFTRLRQDQMARLTRGAPGIGGNQIVIDHGNGEFSFYGHLRPGSVAVRVGQQVARGQRIGAVGSSGNSTEPHLHFHVCDGPDPVACAAIPVQWQALETVMPDPPRAPQTGDLLRQGR